jgi:hypothetical protein
MKFIKRGLRRLAGSFLTNESAPPPQTVPFPAPLRPEPQPEPQRHPQPPESKVRSLRLRANLTIREVAKLVKDKHVRKTVGEACARFYEMFASGNYTLEDLAAYIGTASDGIAVNVYAEKIENTTIREALHYGLLKTVNPPPKDDAAKYEQEEDEVAELTAKDLVDTARAAWREGERTGWDIKPWKKLR